VAVLRELHAALGEVLDMRWWDRVARRDVYLREGDRRLVETQEDGADGCTRGWYPPTEEDASLLV
jgi:hypothetical protein